MKIERNHKPFPLKYLAYSMAVLLLSGCQSDEETAEQVTVEVPFSVQSLPMPNDGYGYDEDGTISLPDEPAFFSTKSGDVSYYQNYETSFAGIDGWGLCVEPIEVPLKSINSGQKYPLDEASLENNVLIINSETSEVIATQKSNDGSNIYIECNNALESSETYHIIVTSGVKTQFGEPLQSSSEFKNLLSAEPSSLNENELRVKDSIDNALTAFSDIEGNTDTVVYASTFTTQDSYAILDSIVENNSESKLTFDDLSPYSVTALREEGNSDYQSGIGDLFVKYELYRGSLESNYYLPFSKEDSENCLLDEYDPVANCPDMYRWMTNEDGSHLTPKHTSPKFTTENIPVDLYLPEGEYEGQSFEKFQNGELPVVIFIHGVTADKSAAALMMKDFVKNRRLKREFAVVAIDMPYHGERIIHDKTGKPISAKEDKSYFINITSPLTLRGNLHQAISDFISLRYALNDFIEEQEVHLVGHSLGGIVSVMFSEMTQNTEELALDTANYVVPGQGLVNLTLESLTLGIEMETAVKSSPDIQRAIAETVIPNQCYEGVSNQDCIQALQVFVENPDNQASVTMLENEIYQAILPLLKKGVQRTIDSADPASKTSRQVINAQPTLLIEAKGNCGETCEVGEYMPDVVIPNATEKNSLTGTEPLIRALQLEDIREDTIDNGVPLRGVIRATVGGHGTYLFPYEGPMDDSGMPSTENLGDVYSSTNTQQEAIHQMIESQGLSITFDEEDMQNIESEVVTEDAAQ
ncbi:alpha/beta fold hydrolase [Photobacterium sp. SDRW27]|uniref:alpha/beta fold hydrolase n=1 Tax=Photobacterium obscurum TaxID=2829490 RepID=UPI0022431BD5|nr:alpha/beta fold hydrolase [Photobacterium obscurum]MCW8329208.1 alpha/beta fold hydrolase [Photobacterium obscurum]